MVRHRGAGPLTPSAGYVNPNGTCQLTDIVSRGGCLLLNVGPTAEGEIPDIQQSSRRSLGRWLAQLSDGIGACEPVDQSVAEATEPLGALAPDRDGEKYAEPSA